jgi:peroxiredoxin
MSDVFTGLVVLGWLVLIADLLLTLAIVRRLNTGPNNRPMPEGMKEGDDAPQFSVSTLMGSTVSMKNFNERPTVFLFVEPSCGPCREAMPEYARLVPLAARAGMDLVVVSGGDERSTRQFVADFDAEWSVLVAPRRENTCFERFKVSATPYFVLIDKEKVRGAGPTWLTFDGWRDLTSHWESSVDAELAPVRP